MKKIIAIIAVMFGVSMFAYAQMNQDQTTTDTSNNMQAQPTQTTQPTDGMMQNTSGTATQQNMQQDGSNPAMKPMQSDSSANSDASSTDNNASNDIADDNDDTDDNDDDMSDGSNDDAQ